MNRCRKVIEKNLYEQNYIFSNNKLRFCEKNVYVVIFENKYFKTNRVFNTLEEAKQYKELCVNALIKAKFINTKGLEDFNNVKSCEYPDNLLSKIGIQEDEKYYKIVLPYFDTNFAKIKKYLREREINYLESYFRDLKSLREIGKIDNISPARARQVIYQAISKIKFRKEMFYETDGELYLLDQETENRLIEETREKLTKEMSKEFALNMVKEMIKNNNEKVIEELNILINEKINKAKNDVSISELGLTTRTYNALRRAGYDKLSYIPFETDPDRLFKIRNLGEKSIKEICDKRDAYLGTVDTYKKIKNPFAYNNQKIIENLDEKELEKRLNNSITSLDLSGRAWSCLNKKGYKVIKDIPFDERLIKIRGIGIKTVKEICDKRDAYLGTINTFKEVKQHIRNDK